MNWAIKTAQNLNHLSQWSIMTPPDIQGNYSWFSLYQEDGAVVLTCQPWHQFVDEKEAIDIWKTFEKLSVSQHAAEKFGLGSTHYLRRTTRESWVLNHLGLLLGTSQEDGHPLDWQPGPPGPLLLKKNLYFSALSILAKVHLLISQLLHQQPTLLVFT